MTREQQQQKEAAIKEALQALANDTRFQTFMLMLRDMREGAVNYMVDHTTVKDEREYLAAVGEVRCFDTIWHAYNSAIDLAVQQQEQQAGPE